MKENIKIFGLSVFSREVVPSAGTVAPIVQDTPLAITEQAPQPDAFMGWGAGYNRFYTHTFNGEKNLGEMGPVKKYLIDHEELRHRSRELYLTSEICQIVISRNKRWVIGSGLTLQAEPQVEVLKDEKIIIDPEEFNRKVEGRFGLYANSITADYSNLRNLHKKAEEAFENSIISGDVLVILRYIKKTVKVQLVDGCHIMNPLGATFNGTDFTNKDNGNIIRHGVEIDETGQHVAYWIRTTAFNSERVPVKGPKSGMQMVFLVTGLKYRLDDVRGIPLLTAVLETAKKMERYKEATLGSAEERQKVAWFVKHGINSKGENPVLSQVKTVSGFGNNTGIPVDQQGKEFANHVAATTNKSTYNLPQDSEMMSLDSKNELYFKDFYTVNIDLVCATVDIPPNVAMGKYDSNFSASRAALKDWEHTLSVKRKDFADQFYKPIYEFWLRMQVLEGKIIAPGFLTAMYSVDSMALEAYCHAQFIGVNVPHIDPEKEVRAERLKLGDNGAHIPLTTVEKATRAVSSGDSTSNIRQFGRELQDADKEGIKPVDKVPVPDKNEKNDD